MSESKSKLEEKHTRERVELSKRQMEEAQGTAQRHHADRVKMEQRHHNERNLDEGGIDKLLSS